MNEDDQFRALLSRKNLKNIIDQSGTKWQINIVRTQAVDNHIATPVRVVDSSSPTGADNARHLFFLGVLPTRSSSLLGVATFSYFYKLCDLLTSE